METFGLKQDEYTEVISEEELHKYAWQPVQPHVWQQQFAIQPHARQQQWQPQAHMAVYLQYQTHFMQFRAMENVPSYNRQPRRNDFPLDEWKLLKGSNATYKELICSYIVVGDKLAAEKVCRFLQKLSPVPVPPPTPPVLLAIGKTPKCEMHNALIHPILL